MWDLGQVELPHVSQKRANVGHQAERFINKTWSGAGRDSFPGCFATPPQQRQKQAVAGDPGSLSMTL